GSDDAAPAPTRERMSPRTTTTPVASRCSAIATCRKGESGAVDSQACCAVNASISADALVQLIPTHPPAGSCARGQSPTPPGVSSSASRNGACSYSPAASGNASCSASPSPASTYQTPDGFSS